ncbi:hypothetical protein [Prosthecobacter dejongeii]|uniref:Phage terminase Nu1 subunit (DNA packaging protein) n=1 Tax=Prosthecobacter dejongeii TaxID=48465 RepID=A0A7W7YJ70_9BACT|nr:hypothetical protein [Prosthecobacter dejongeii]MBB5037121.1 phage terminase Nu1 subunit (DNA packaging protein) [Prosthecobacter dejongeii]
MIASAIKGADSLPATEKADVYEGIAQIAERAGLATTARDALNLANALREAEMLQLNFREFAQEGGQ